MSSKLKHLNTRHRLTFGLRSDFERRHSFVRRFGHLTEAHANGTYNGFGR